VDLAPSALARDHVARMTTFLHDRILPTEATYAARRAERQGTAAQWDVPL